MKSNPLPAKALSQAHDALLRDLRGLGRFIQANEHTNIAELRTRLAKTQADLGEQFRLEEMGGYLDDVQTDEPRLQRTVEELGDEHRELVDALVQIRDEAEVAGDVDEILRLKVHNWIDRLLRHEGGENDLVVDAVDVDCGGGD